MLINTRQVVCCMVVIGALLLAACGGSEATSTLEPEILQPTSPPELMPTIEREAETEETPVSIGECEGQVSELTLGSPISSEVVGTDQPPKERMYFCVLIPDGTSRITFELSEMTADLNLYVGHPDLETVQNGGVWFWASDERGMDNKVIVVEPALTEFVNAGSYYIEVSAQDFEDSATFSLGVSNE